MSEDIVNVTKQNFEETIINSTLPVMLVFWSQKYPGCHRLAETMETLAICYHGSIKFGLVDVDNQIELSSQLGIGGLPCVLVLSNGRLCANIGGELPLDHYKNIIDRMLAESEAKKKPEKMKKRLFKK